MYRFLSALISISLFSIAILSFNASDVLAYNSGIEAFVKSLYADCLGREADPLGLDDWCSRLTSGQTTGKEAAYGFFFSTEFTNKANSLTDDQLIDIYYRVFLNRQADDGGKEYWMEQIYYTSNPVAVLFTGFSDSAEFENKCICYGITAGPHIDAPSAFASAGRTTGGLATFDEFRASNSSRGWDEQTAWDHYYEYIYYWSYIASDDEIMQEAGPVNTDLGRYCEQFIGIPYVFGGMSTSGFDCSGLVAYVYSHYYGITLPHNAAAMSSYGEEVTGSLEPGDILCCDLDLNGSIDHAMMYVGTYFLDTGFYSDKVTMRPGVPDDIIVTIRRFNH